MTNRAFSLIELLVVITIIAMLSAMTLGALASVRKAAQRHETLLLIGKVDAATLSFKTDAGFYPKGEYAAPPVEYVSSGFDKGLLLLDPFTELPVPTNDDVWLPSGSDDWRNGNGLFARLGREMPESDRIAARTNAERLSEVERDRFYHIGNFGNQVSDGLAKPGGWVMGTWSLTGSGPPQSEWCYVDPVGPISLGERELKKVFDHFRFAPKVIRRNVNPWTASVKGNETGVGTSKHWTMLMNFLTDHFNRYVGMARPRDASDAYRRALRDGTEAGSISYDSAFNAAGVALADGALATHTLAITANEPWSSGYLMDLEPRYRRDVDGDGKEDLIDAYGQPLVYINEGMPAAKSIHAPNMKIRGNPSNSLYWGQSPDEYGNLLLYHPDPDRESSKFINANTVHCFITDMPNSKGVDVRSDAYDISFLGPDQGSAWIFHLHGFKNTDYYPLAGTLIPSRMRILTQTVANRDGVYYLLSQDGTKLIEPFADNDASGTWDIGEVFIDRNRNGTYNGEANPIADNDVRLCAPAGLEREVELISAGPDRRFHAHRQHEFNRDNLTTTTRK